MTICNVPNRTIFCDDNLDVLRGINSECIDLIYLDPPFNKNKKFTAPIGTSAEGAEFSDIFREEDVKYEWLVTLEQDQPELYHYLTGIRAVDRPYNFAYLAYMAIRLIECQRILKPSGSVYLHCDPTMSHYLKIAMDCIFGEHNFRNEIVWCYRGGGVPKKDFARKHDIIFRYCPEIRKFNVDDVRIPYSQDSTDRLEYTARSFRSTKVYDGYEQNPKGKHPEDWWVMQPIMPSSKERTGYPTQKPVKLMERIIQASSNEGDIVFDPFCGCATTCVAAERLNRQWIGVDISYKAYELVKKRLTKESVTIWQPDTEIHMRTDPPKRTDIGKDYREKKFVYVISHPAYPGEYKVGIAKNWRSRLNAYQTSNPDRRYKVEFKLETPYFRETEKHIHEVFPNKHEWVQGDLNNIITAIKQFRREMQ